MPKAKPAYREVERMGSSRSGRGGAPITNFFLHTQEGNGTAESLAGYLNNSDNGVSYHYTVDNGGTVVDVVDTDYSSWAVLNANPIAINLCFAGSRAGWSRQQWLDLMGRGIEIAAWIAVQDCRKYGIPTTVIAPPYRRGSGISDHNYVTQVLGMGTHTDVGPGFPWDVFAAHIRDFTTDTPGGILMALNDDEQRALLADVRYIREQLGPKLSKWGEDSSLGRNAKGEELTLRDGIAAFIRKAAGK